MVPTMIALPPRHEAICQTGLTGPHTQLLSAVHLPNGSFSSGLLYPVLQTER